MKKENTEFFVITKSGRKLYPPFIRVTSERLAKKDSKNADKWLIEQTKEECKDESDYVKGFVWSINADNMSQGDMDTLNYFLMGEDKQVLFPLYFGEKK